MSDPATIRKEWAQQVREHALKNYETDGWDYVYECWELDYIVEMTKDCTTFREALKLCHETAMLLDERRTEIQNA